MRRDVVYAAALAVLAIAFVYFFLPFELPKGGQKTAPSMQNNTFDDRLKKFLDDNPNANESYARDVVSHDLAIESRNSSMCEGISDDALRRDCLFYFQVASK